MSAAPPAPPQGWPWDYLVDKEVTALMTAAAPCGRHGAGRHGDPRTYRTAARRNQYSVLEGALGQKGILFRSMRGERDGAPDE